MDKGINNFKRIQEENEQKYEAHPLLEEIHMGLMKSLTTFKFVGQMVEMYVPRMIDTLVVAAGGSSEEQKDSRYDIPPSQGPGEDPRNIKPGPPGAP